MTYEYNAQRINAGIKARKVLRSKCRAIALQYSPVPLPDSVIARICSRRKLYCYLEAMDLPVTQITAIFHAHNMPVPRDHSLKPTAEPKQEPKPEWLNFLDKTDDRDIFF